MIAQLPAPSAPLRDSLRALEEDLHTITVEIEDMDRYLESLPALADSPECARVFFGLRRLEVAREMMADGLEVLRDRLGLQESGDAPRMAQA